MLNEFLLWYGQRMLELLPGSLRGRSQRFQDALIAEIQPAETGTGPKLKLVLRNRRVEHDLGAYGIDPAGVTAMRTVVQQQTLRGKTRLRVDPDMILEREIVLPLAAERDPARVLEYEMDRNTPFRSDELFWTWTVERRDIPRGRLHVRLSAVLQVKLQPILSALEQIGATVTQLDATLATGAVRVIGLQRSGSANPPWFRNATAGVGIVCALLAIAVVALPFVWQSSEQSRLEEQMVLLKPQIAQAEALRRASQAKTAGSDIFTTEHARVGNALEVLAAVTDVMPDDTFLTDLTLREGLLSLEGQSVAAARLIPALSNDPVLRNPSFSAPVTRLENGRADQFSIRAEVSR